MDAPILVAAVAFAGVLALAFALSQVAQRRPAAVINRRLDAHAVALALEEGKRLERINVLKEPSYSASPRLNALLRRLRPARTAVRELTRADVGLSVLKYLLLRLIVGVGLYAVVRTASGNLAFALAAGGVGLMLPRFYLRLRARRRLKAFEGQLAEMIELLVGALRSGHGFLQAIEAAAREMDDPMRKELLQVVDQVNVGVNPADALQALTGRIESYDLALFAAAITVQRQAGGNLAEVLDNLAATVRERRRVRGEVRALTTGPRVSSYILFAVPIGLLFYCLAVSAEYRETFGTSFGKAALAAAGVWALIGFLLARKVAKVEY